MFVMYLIYEANRFQSGQLEDDLKELLREIQATVSYTHLTLPTNREV